MPYLCNTCGKLRHHYKQFEPRIGAFCTACLYHLKGESLKINWRMKTEQLLKKDRNKTKRAMKSKKKSRYKFFGYNGSDIQRWISATSFHTGDHAANLWIVERSNNPQVVLKSMDKHYNKKTTR